MGLSGFVRGLTEVAMTRIVAMKPQGGGVQGARAGNIPQIGITKALATTGRDVPLHGGGRGDILTLLRCDSSTLRLQELVA